MRNTKEWHMKNTEVTFDHQSRLTLPVPKSRIIKSTITSQLQLIQEFQVSHHHNCEIKVRGQKKKNNSKSWLLSLLCSSMIKWHCPDYQISDPLDLTQRIDVYCYCCCLRHFALPGPSFAQCMHYINEAGFSLVEILLCLLPTC